MVAFMRYCQYREEMVELEAVVDTKQGAFKTEDFPFMSIKNELEAIDSIF